jgi:pimeloyl-ACP methyl ester carboxylesterase
MDMARLLPRGLASRGREVAALARQAWLLRHDVRDAVLPKDAAEGDHVVVFLHGLFASAGVLRPLRDAVTAHADVHAAAMTYPPGPGIETLAERLGALVAELPARSSIHLVGHSLGGIVARFFAQEHGDPRVVQTISLASPFYGVPRARLLGLESAKDLDESSPLLRRIQLGAAVTEHVPHLSILAADDAFMRSPVAQALPGSEVVVLEGRGHNGMLFDPDVARLVAHRILSRKRPRAPRSATTSW